MLAFKPKSGVFENVLLSVKGMKFNREATRRSYLNLRYAPQVLRLFTTTT